MATYYINADTGDNGDTGGSGDPWETLAYAYDNSSAGDTIICQESVASYAWVTDTIQDRTIQGPAADNPAVFDGAGASVTWSIRDTLNITNIRFTNVTTSSGGRLFYFAETGTHTFTNCRFDNITLTAPTSTAAFFSPNGNSYATPLTCSFVGCMFDDIQRNGGSFFYFPMRMFTLSPNKTQTLNFTHCVFYIETDATDLFWNHSADNTYNINITNSIFSNASGGVVRLKSGVGGSQPLNISATYSDFYEIDDNPTGTGNITGDPLFEDATGGDFNLRPGSPCINTGTVP